MTLTIRKSASREQSDLPRFDRAPVIEVVLSLQFDPLPGLQIHHFGLLWSQYKERYPKVESHPPIDRSIEVFQREPTFQPAVSFELVNPFMTPRVWFVSESGAELVQIQRDRFIINWRKRKPTDVYPHYDAIRERMVRELDAFLSFVTEHKLGDVVGNQCEVTYINQIDVCPVWDHHRQVGKVLNVMTPEFKEASLPMPELFRFAAQYIMGDPDAPIGRLHLEFQPAFRAMDRKPVFGMNLTARGKPIGGTDIEAALKFFDMGRSNIVRGFRDLTTPEMHTEWGLHV